MQGNNKMTTTSSSPDFVVEKKEISSSKVELQKRILQLIPRLYSYCGSNEKIVLVLKAFNANIEISRNTIGEWHKKGNEIPFSIKLFGERWQNIVKLEDFCDACEGLLKRNDLSKYADELSLKARILETAQQNVPAGCKHLVGAWIGLYYSEEYGAFLPIVMDIRANKTVFLHAFWFKYYGSFKISGNALMMELKNEAKKNVVLTFLSNVENIANSQEDYADIFTGIFSFLEGAGVESLPAAFIISEKAFEELIKIIGESRHSSRKPRNTELFMKSLQERCAKLLDDKEWLFLETALKQAHSIGNNLILPKTEFTAMNLEKAIRESQALS